MSRVCQGLFCTKVGYTEPLASLKCNMSATIQSSQAIEEFLF